MATQDAFTSALGDWIADATRVVAGLDLGARIEHVGQVTRIGDAVATVVGLPETRQGELLRFEDGTLGLALSVASDSVECVLIQPGTAIAAGSRVVGTGEVARVPVGDGLLGRVVDALGTPLDDGPPIDAGRSAPVEKPAPGVIERGAITQSMMTGITVVDALIPLGRGQRTLVMGDRKTGKTAIAVDAVINQRHTDVVCVYAMIGQKASTIEHVINAVREHGAMDRCIFVVGEASATPAAQWLVPYAACSMAEFFRDKGQHALLVLDDLTKHAIVYREMSLLLRRPPGREAYPGDIFYIHSRLLERASKLSNERGGGSLTALPIIETQAGNLSAYIPTNLISITDGQIYLESKLFYEGQKPAVNVGLSVSRVGSKSQAPVLREAAGSLKLEYAQFVELEIFTRFGATVDERTRTRIEHGRRIREILVQDQYVPRSLTLQTGLLIALQEGRLDGVTPGGIEQLKSTLEPHLRTTVPQIVTRIERDRSISPEDRKSLLAAIDAFLATLDHSKPAS